MENEELGQDRPEPDLLASGIHETRRPLTLVRGYAQMIRDRSLGPLTDAQEQALRRIDEKLAEANAQLERLDTVVRVATRLQDCRSLAVDEEVRHAIRRAGAKSELLGGTMEPHLAPGTVAFADAALLARILDNLLDNALTYSDGPPEVTVEVGQQETPFVRVSDHGFGLSVRGAAKLFGRSFRDRPRDDRRPGSGLGLYLSRRAAENMGGTLGLERSSPGGGATFRLDLRRAP